MAAVAEDVVALIARITKLPADKLLPTTDLRKDYNVDSLLGLQIVAGIEKKFNVTIPDDNLDDYATVGKICSLVERLAAAPK